MSVVIEEVAATIMEPQAPPAEFEMGPVKTLDMEAVLRAIRREQSRSERRCAD